MPRSNSPLAKAALAVLVSAASLAVAPHADAAETSARLVLVVSNNRGGDLGRPDLHYADDDGAKYRALFRAGAERPSDVVLLTRYDRDTARLFPEGPDDAPTRSALGRSVTTLADRAAELRRNGRDVEFIFVYAGHGDVDRGKGFVELEDGTFSSDDLSSLVKRVGATRSHVILDSCNSVFLVSPRSPGGRHVSTSAEAATALQARLPDVGVLLSSSADGEVFEWSELGAGVFSHVVRSGLGGAADANGDGRVTYGELRSFVTVATAEIRNPRYRPTLFAHGPSGDDGATIFTPGAAKGRHITIPAGSRMTLRDADDIPWLDVHTEASTGTAILVPEPIAKDGTIETLETVAGQPPRVIARASFVDPDSPPITVIEQHYAARGRDDLYGTLFVRPFGPSALSATLRATSEETQGFGVSSNDVTRFKTLLHEVEDSDRTRRRWDVFGGVTTGIVSAGAGAFVLAMNDEQRATDLGVTYIGVGVGLGIGSLFTAFRSLPSEKLRLGFERDVATMGPSAAMERAEVELALLARRERRGRIVGGIALGAGVGLVGTLVVLNELSDTPNLQTRGLGVANLVALVALTPLLLTPTPIERLAHVWSTDPSRSPRVSLSPTGPGGPGLALSGTF